MNREEWQSRWQSGQTGWDIGVAHPALGLLWHKALAAGLTDLSGSIYVPGCGSGHEAAFIAKQDKKVKAVDFVPEAISAAKQTYGQIPGLKFEVADVFDVPLAHRGTFDAVIDRAMLCALNESQRASYVGCCFDLLNRGGLFIGILFSEVLLAEGRMGPPFGLTVMQVSALMEQKFTLVCGWEQKAPEHPAAIMKEFCCIWRRC